MGILIRNNIVNQKGNPAWYEDTLANRPTANLQGRMFVDTDNPSTGIYRDTGSSWVAVADPGAGTTGTLQQVTTNGSTTNVGISITTLTPGSVLFSGTGGLISQDNSNLFWDDANNFLGIGPTGGPSALLDIHSATQNVFIQVNATSTNNSQVAFLNGGVGKWRIGNLYNAGANDFIIYDTTNTLSRLTIKNNGNVLIGTTTDSGYKLNVNGNTYISGSLGVIGDTQMSANAAILGYLNIGTASITVPNTKLQVYNFGESRTQFHGYNTSNGVFATLAFGNTNDIVGGYVTASIAAHRKDYDNGGELVFSTALSASSPTERMRLKSNGVLDVIGSIQIGNTVTAGVAVASTHKVTILIGGVTYYLLASNV